jgi:GntR family transcriptional regulator of arabinose operon
MKQTGGEQSVTKRKAKYQMVQEAIMEWTRASGLSVGNQLPTEDALAAKFQVSRQTVRQAVGNLVALGILSREQGRGTFFRGEWPSHISEHASTKLIGVVVTYLNSYIFPHIIRGIEDRLSPEGYALIVQSTGNDVRRETRTLERLLQQRVDGIIVEPTRSAFPNPNRSIYQELVAGHFPLVTINASYPGVTAPSVELDDVHGGKLVTEHLLKMGHASIGAIMKVDDRQGVRRLSGMLSALNSGRVEFQSAWTHFFTTDSRRDIVREYVDAYIAAPIDQRPTAVFCYNDELAVELIKQLHERGIVIPRDLSIVGYDDSEIANAVPHGLTTVVHPKVDMGHAAAEILLGQLGRDRMLTEGHTYTPQLVERGTVLPNIHALETV